MNVIRRMVVGLAGIVVVALAFSLVAPKAVHAIVSTLVTVTNGSGNPVPTVAVDTRNVNVLNTPSVNVASLPAVQLNGAINATVSNPTDGSGNPIPLVTRDSDSPARHANAAQCNGSNNGGNIAGCFFPAVPAGQELVIQGVTLAVRAPTGAAIDADFITVVNGVRTAHEIELKDGGPCSICGAAVDLFSGQFDFPIYADPGTTPEANMTYMAIGSPVSIHAAISGYFVTVP